jgi:hypothetical protein
VDLMLREAVAFLAEMLVQAVCWRPDGPRGSVNDVPHHRLRRPGYGTFLTRIQATVLSPPVSPSYPWRWPQKTVRRTVSDQRVNRWWVTGE